MGPWARSFVAAVVGNAERPGLEVRELTIEPGLISARVGEAEVSLSAVPIPQRIWAPIIRYAQGMGQLEESVEGRFQSVHLEHLLEEDWGEKLVPRSSAITRSGGDRELAAVAFAVADRIDESPAELLVWRGIEGGERVRPTADPWVGGELAQLEPRVVPEHAVLKRLGPSGIPSASGDLSNALRVAYDAF